MKVHAIFEGRTEEKVLNRLERLADCSFELTPSDGKNKMRKTIVGLIGPLIGSGPIRVVILRDLDHDETIDQVVQRTTDALKQAFEGRNPSVVPQLDRLDDNVYVWRSADDLDIRVALHIATYRWNKAFIKTKIDDYILSTKHSVATRYSHSSCPTSRDYW
ncbi:MAG: hypothetical protein D6735_05665 [Acidobacteria bacterium]|nr:MAG: hypothetical protein D6735_05665 [Acidobacteriota bacterium]